MLAWIKRIFILILLIIALAAGAAYWWLQQPLSLRQPVVEISISRGSSAKTVANQLVDAGVQTPKQLLYGWFRLSGRGGAVKAGSYEIPAGVTPEQLLEMLVSGKQATRSVRLLEGWTMRQFRAALATAPHLRQDSAKLTDAQVMAKLGFPQLAAEGQFFPDTYVYAKNSSDLTVLEQAFKAMQQRSQIAWEMRADDLAINSPYELIVMASIIEKETGASADRYLVAGVFANRLKKGMLLQTDPTVVYGVSEAKGLAFTDRIRYRHLRDDNPWNTYIYPGLPPTPIAMPSNASLLAAANPAKTKALYFVAKGGGESHFSESLAEHNRAVNTYIRQRSN